VIDNFIVHDHLLNTMRNISFPSKLLIIGTVAEECFDFIYGTWGKPITASEYIALALLIFQENWFKIIKQYPPNASDDQRS